MRFQFALLPLVASLAGFALAAPRPVDGAALMVRRTHFLSFYGVLTFYSNFRSVIKIQVVAKELPTLQIM
jgi:hypothetical protein